MALTYIAFRECVFEDDPPFWKNIRENRDPEEDDFMRETREEYIATDDGAKLSLVDLEGKKRYFIFTKGGVVDIASNVATFQDGWQEKLA